MKLSRRLLLLLFCLAIPLILTATGAAYWMIRDGFVGYEQRTYAAERAHLQMDVEHWLTQNRKSMTAIRTALESERPEALDFLVAQARQRGLISLVMNHHGELHVLQNPALPVDGNSEAMRALLDPILSTGTFQYERSGFARLGHQVFGLVAQPLNHRNWRGLIGIQAFDQTLLDTLSYRHHRIHTATLVDAPEGSPLALPHFAGTALTLEPQFDLTERQIRTEQIHRVMAILALVLVLLALASFFTFRRILLGPIGSLKQRIEQGLTQRKTSRPLPESGQDELSEISQLCNELFSQRLHQRQQISTLLRTVSDAVVLVDPQARIELVNPEAEKLLAVEHGPVRQCALVNLVAGPAGQELHAALKELLSSGRISLEGRVSLQQGGQKRQLEYHAARTLDHEGHTLGAVLVLRDITHSEQMKRELMHKSQRDQTTGIYNRHTFEQRLEALADLPGQHAICYMDLNRFKLINDSCGHEAGDRMLRDVAQEMVRSIRPGDLLARIGGDEFGLIMKDTSALETARVLKQLMERVEGITLYWDSGSYRVGISIGVAFQRADEQRPREVFKDAEIACHANKGKGGESQIHFFDSLDQDLAHQRNAPQWAMKINEAIVNDDLVLFYQPIEPVQASSPRRKCEVLLRIREEGGRILAPGQFIAAAERFNLMPAVDKAVIRKSFEWLARNSHLWNTQVLSINLSGTTLSNGNLVSYIDEMCALYRVPPETICFEVTETAAIANENRALEILHALRRRGFAFALDDFGSGFASYGYLRQLPVDYVKIDGCFVRNLANNAKDYAIVKSIHDVCRVMGIETVAEFVEDQETLSRLRAIGVNYAQGYGIGRPKDLETYQPVPQEDGVKA
ncbi:diguanylate cyclase/phosphodiesterase with PAS/PAC sensor(s) [Ferrimonas balearica DSM 9799]|uniref:Diguanylate cyclase/phosphodiesterase with PAS/PAC sensor(S) n=1 Tax=Ferrimonas balearica (strain DSM 9799 / CCM 4581 / KCTC 23876 / PAT) TaxID=550540 RepID=E1SN97_FERBD|nr:EAL domain-containing protein [Ferrimonas balearica]ADN74596.1 diguanylate cyclase/phosphodiesterase with PAS/PAC sensor(s) [Ferrimonas balearica DSM 9799]